jgi:hypothetical protein
MARTAMPKLRTCTVIHIWVESEATTSAGWMNWMTM